MDFRGLDATIQDLCHKGLAHSTHRTYKAAVNRYTSFCVKYGISNAFPTNELILCRFVASLAQDGLAPSTVKSYLSGIRHAQIMDGYPDIHMTDTMPRLKLLQSGVARDRAARGVQTKQRLPITVGLLRSMLNVWTTLDRDQAFNHTMLRAAATVCFFGFFRSGEITVPSRAACDSRYHLYWGDVAVEEGNPPAMIRVHLKRSKCDQLGRGVSVFIGRSGVFPCAVTEVMNYVRVRGPDPGPFFRFADGCPLTKAAFVARVKSALSASGISPDQYSGHSFRVGAATAAAEAGLEDSTVRLLGRWSSDAFLRYVRTPRDSLAAFSSAIVRPASTQPSGRTATH